MSDDKQCGSEVGRKRPNTIIGNVCLVCLHSTVLPICLRAWLACLPCVALLCVALLLSVAGLLARVAILLA